MRKSCTNQYRILKIDTLFGEGGTQFYGQNDFMDIWAFLSLGIFLDFGSVVCSLNEPFLP